MTRTSQIGSTVNTGIWVLIEMVSLKILSWTLTLSIKGIILDLFQPETKHFFLCSEMYFERLFTGH